MKASCTTVILLWVSLLAPLTRAQDPCPAGDLLYPDWMGELQTASAATNLAHKWGDATLLDILMPGSHDAGTSEVTSSPVYVNNDWVITQTFKVRDQLCFGSRFFDIRYKWKKNQWFTNHGATLCESRADVEKGLMDFLDHHPNEIVIFRLKISTSTAEGVASLNVPGSFRGLIRDIRVDFHDYIINTANLLTTSYTNLLAAKTAQNKGGVIFMFYEAKCGGVDMPLWPNGFLNDGTVGNERIYNYRDMMTGKYASSRFTHDVVPAQWQNLNGHGDYNIDQNKMHGTWWTFTGWKNARLAANVEELTFAEHWFKYPYLMIDFFIYAAIAAPDHARRPIGNVLVVDFIGRYPPRVMDIVLTANYNKYVFNRDQFYGLSPTRPWLSGGYDLLPIPPTFIDVQHQGADAIAQATTITEVYPRQTHKDMTLEEMAASFGEHMSMLQTQFRERQRAEAAAEAERRRHHHHHHHHPRDNEKTNQASELSPFGRLKGKVGALPLTASVGGEVGGCCVVCSDSTNMLDTSSLKSPKELSGCCPFCDMDDDIDGYQPLPNQPSTVDSNTHDCCEICDIDEYYPSCCNVCPAGTAPGAYPFIPRAPPLDTTTTDTTQTTKSTTQDTTSQTTKSPTDTTQGTKTTTQDTTQGTKSTVATDASTTKSTL